MAPPLGVTGGARLGPSRGSAVCRAWWLAGRSTSGTTPMEGCACPHPSPAVLDLDTKGGDTTDRTDRPGRPSGGIDSGCIHSEGPESPLVRGRTPIGPALPRRKHRRSPAFGGTDVRSSRRGRSGLRVRPQRPVTTRAHRLAVLRRRPEIPHCGCRRRRGENQRRPPVGTKGRRRTDGGNREGQEPGSRGTRCGGVAAHDNSRTDAQHLLADYLSPSTVPIHATSTPLVRMRSNGWRSH